MKLYKHQRKAVDELSSGKILYADVGTGKSLTALTYYVEKQAPRDLYILTTAMKRNSLDWEEEAVKVRVSKYEQNPETGAKLVAVDSWNNIAKYKAVRNSFFIFDEQRLVGSGAWAKAFLHITKPEKNNQWIVLSATPGDQWMDYAAIFIANGFYKNRTEFIREHVVYSNYTKFPKIERYVAVDRLKKYRRQLLVHMPYERHTTRVTTNVRVEFNHELLNKVMKERWNPYEERPIRSLPEYFYIMRRVVYSDPSRVEAVRRYLQKHPRLIVFYSFDYELEALRKLSSEVTIGEWNGHNHDDIPDTERWLYLVQYIAGSEGWNCTTTDATLFYSLTYSYKQWYQAHGRIDRLNTSFSLLNYYVLLSDAPIDEGVMSTLKTKHSFNEVEFIRKFGTKTLSVS